MFYYFHRRELGTIPAEPPSPTQISLSLFLFFSWSLSLCFCPSIITVDLRPIAHIPQKLGNRSLWWVFLRSMWFILIHLIYHIIIAFLRFPFLLVSYWIEFQFGVFLILFFIVLTNVTEKVEVTTGFVKIFNGVFVSFNGCN